jgi:hypothetical protein
MEVIADLDEVEAGLLGADRLVDDLGRRVRLRDQLESQSHRRLPP